MNKKKYVLVAIIILALVLALLILPGQRTIGTVSGPENDFITIDGVVYVKDSADHYQDFSIADKGRRLGTIPSRYVKLRIFSVKDDPDREYLYVSSGYEGDYYIREDLTEKET